VRAESACTPKALTKKERYEGTTSAEKNGDMVECGGLPDSS
jgi:hypothetical protein